MKSNPRWSMVAVMMLLSFAFAVGFSSVSTAGYNDCCNYLCPCGGGSNGYVDGAYLWHSDSCVIAYPDYPECIMNPLLHCNSCK